MKRSRILGYLQDGQEYEIAKLKASSRGWSVKGEESQNWR
ncbi:hypothetical protein E2C01_051496 [Portunus trituberculatus]|uniref:Uncharacterized protein n=1 Tax=Portunus trituberculatus TaxID=210409 RepID=A0A5B7GJC9_PORTR|nr:hypothetical protein [Portunus trituberculatus]